MQDFNICQDKLSGHVILADVLNANEDFHYMNLSDKQMEELNPIIRNAIYTAIYAQEAR